MSDQSKFSIITVNATRDGDYFFVNSQELPGLALKGKNCDIIFKKLPHLIKELYKDNYGLAVDVSICSELEEPTWKLAIAA